YAVVEVDASMPHTLGVQVPLTLGSLFVVFPEGYSYPTRPASGDPMAVVSENERGGRVVNYPGRPDALYWNVPYPDLGRLIANAVRWTAHDRLPVRVEAPPTLQVSVRKQLTGQYDRRRLLVHLVNLTGERFFDGVVPLYDVKVAIPVDQEKAVKVFLLSSGETLPVQVDDKARSIIVPKVVDYEVVVIEL
ncbi:MAG: hypothetical protein ACK2UQ_10555, partial [Anaerolineae bacterium]